MLNGHPIVAHDNALHGLTAAGIGNPYHIALRAVLESPAPGGDQHVLVFSVSVTSLPFATRTGMRRSAIRIGFPVCK